ncbi:Rieske 2Fe-2S domain-containing protein [Mucilaginibacter sp. Bleaf8]|uniref:DUF2231 domain-containing protein n=1 Tax=Mucilaginibacter sp. Bleaf8 TaxID=2834430 RepID=UPI001BD12E47|nr:DUF2231 domain-containing protein [Mucilaginibacter sp. Bleaf8]MBS7564966.1 Rieske 2Fe-2S domain-containing protein [Mucilaginibacter sp. Bleaf8]
MKSRANLKGHPIHPLLIPFPIAFFIGTLFFDVLSAIYNNPGFWQTGKYLNIAGIVTALAAAIPGIIDYIYTVPPQSSAKKRGATHGILNTVVVVLYAVAYYLKEDHSTILILAIEAIGSVLLFISGWLGGTLSYRNQIGVDPRYADAGKWKEAYLDETNGIIEVAATDELKTDQMKLLHVAGKRIVLGKTEDGYVAFDDRCSHKGGSLAGGMMICGTVQCPWHGSQFDCKTGAVKAGPAKEKIAVYTVSEKSGIVYLQL